MKVLAVDPGYDRLGVAVLELVNGKELLHYSTCIESDKSTPLQERLKFVGDKFQALLVEYIPDTVAIETLFFNQNVSTAIGVAQARGIISYLAQLGGCKVYEFGPQEIKVAVTGHGGSDKKAVIDMVRRLVPQAPQKALDDEYDAIAVGITCLAVHGRTR
ncbi:crossover junction endodeoxyribonuclease RuvC [Candidatus Kaiserbacteria bacterium]|nr:crossover junction endodeoxyribonuclease RuvC [Candidatus Kaiserbacteria bacterium]